MLRGSPSSALEEGRASGPAPLRATLSCPPTAELLAPKMPINNKTDLQEVGLSFTRSTGLEPVASTVTGWRDNQLHQDPKCNMKAPSASVSLCIIWDWDEKRNRVDSLVQFPAFYVLCVSDGTKMAHDTMPCRPLENQLNSVEVAPSSLSPASLFLSQFQPQSVPFQHLCQLLQTGMKPGC